MTVRHRYIIRLEDLLLAVPQVEARHPGPEDAEALAHLMLEAYRGTIDYDGEGIDEARSEVSGWLSDDANLELSWLALDPDGHVVSACLVSDQNDGPLVGYVMTVPERKNHGLASALLRRTLATAMAAGHTQVEAWITEGNHPSEKVFLAAGFRLEDPA